MTLQEIMKKQDKKNAQRIADYLIKRVETDLPLREKMESTDKTLKGCVDYVKDEMQKQAEDGWCWCEDEDVWNLVIHYFMEDSIDFEDKEKPSKEKSKKQPKIEKIETLFGVEEIVVEEKQSKPKPVKPKKDIKESLCEQLALFDDL